eukprot:880615-Prorocentrum_minimum.AAC.1
MGSGGDQEGVRRGWICAQRGWICAQRGCICAQRGWIRGRRGWIVPPAGVGGSLGRSGEMRTQRGSGGDLSIKSRRP